MPTFLGYYKIFAVWIGVVNILANLVALNSLYQSLDCSKVLLSAFTTMMFTYGEEESSTKSPSFFAESPAGIAVIYN